MKLISLGSSSHGNSYILNDGQSRLMLECGLTWKKLQQRLHESGYGLADLDAVLITHEHQDHAKNWQKLYEAGLDIYASHGTIEALGAERKLLPLAPEPGKHVGTQRNISGYDVIPFRTFHDAKEPIGFLIRSRADGDKLVFATDTVNLRYQFQGINLLAVEANYADEIIAGHTRIPEDVKKRIRHSHMEIGTLCGWLSTLDLSRCREVYLMHLSDASSDEAWFVEQVKAVVPKRVRVIAFPRGG